MPQIQILPKRRNQLAEVFGALGEGAADLLKGYRESQDTQRALAAANQPGFTEYDKFQAIMQASPMADSQQQKDIYQMLSGLDQQQKQREAQEFDFSQKKASAQRSDALRNYIASKPPGEPLTAKELMQFMDSPKDAISLQKEEAKAMLQSQKDQAYANLRASEEFQKASPVKQSQMIARVDPSKVVPFQRELAETRQEKNQELLQKRWEDEQSEKWRDSVLDQAEKAEDLDRSLDEMERLIETGDATAENRWNLLSNLFPEGVPPVIRNAFMTDNAQLLKSASVQQVINMSKAFGYNFTDRDLALVADKIADVTKSGRANKSIISLGKLNADLQRRRSEIMNDIIDSNDGFAPKNIRSLTEQRLKNDPIMRNAYGTAYRTLISTDKNGKRIPGKWFKKDIPADPEKGLPARPNVQHFITMDQIKKNPMLLKSYQASWEEIE